MDEFRNRRVIPKVFTLFVILVEILLWGAYFWLRGDCAPCEGSDCPVCAAQLLRYAAVALLYAWLIVVLIRMSDTKTPWKNATTRN